MSRLLTDLGEEYAIKNGLDSGTTAWSVGLYDDSSAGTTGDAISDGDDLSAITTEPAGTSYARQTSQFSPADLSGDWGSDNDSKLTFDTSDSSGTVDSWFLVINFQASDTGDTSANDHLVATGALSQEYDLSNVDTLDVSAGGVGVTVS